MNIRYWLLLAATSASLAACSSNSSRPDETARTTGAISPGSVVVTDTAGAPDISASTVADTTKSRSPGSFDSMENGHPAGATESQPSRRPRYGRRTPTTLADAPTIGDDENGAATAVNSAAVAALSRFLATGLPPAQRFAVRPGRDTVVVGPQNTQILLPAHIWDLPAADSNAVVRLEIQEFYTAADMLLAGLSTMAGPDLLETGGMLRLTATANGRPVRLRPGRYLHLRMPTKKAKPGMQLFEGITDDHQRTVDWQLPGGGHTPDGLANGPKKRRRALRAKPAGPAQPSDSASAVRPATRWPEYANGMENQLRVLLPQSGRLRRNRNSSPLAKGVLGNLSKRYDERIVRYVNLNFTVDSSGTMRQVVPRQGSDPELTPAISALLRRMVPTKPAGLPHFVKRQVVYEPAAATGVVHIDFARSGKIIITQPTWSLARASKLRARVLKHEVDSLLADKSFLRSYRRAQDSVAVTQRGLMWAKYEADQVRLRTQFTDTSRAAITEQGVFNELSAQGMGWINCDRFLQAKRLTTLQVQSPGTAATVTSLLFEDINSIMRGVSLSGTVTAFGNVPVRMRATVVAIKREAGITYLATQKLVISDAPVSGLAFHPVTMAQLRTELDLLQ